MNYMPKLVNGFDETNTSRETQLLKLTKKLAENLNRLVTNIETEFVA